MRDEQRCSARPQSDASPLVVSNVMVSEVDAVSNSLADADRGE